MLAGPSRPVGNLDVERDFSDVRDVVRGYVALFEKATSGEAYNLGSGKSTSVRSILERLRGLCRVPIEVETDPQKVRSGEIPRIVASNAKIESATGWRPQIALEQTLADLLDFWRRELSR